MMKERWSASAEKGKLKKGPWTFEEDVRLLRSIRIYGEGRWSALAKAAGLQRCGKSCRLRWVNYLRPDLKRGNITPEEERMIIDLHSRWGNRWSLIAEKMPGRTDNEIKNYWRCHLKKKLQAAAAAAGTTAIAAANSMHDKAVEDRNSYRPSNINPYKMMTTEGLQSQIGSNHSHSPSYGQNSSMNMDCSQTGPDTFALLSPPLPVPAEPKTELSEQHQAAAAAACSSSSLESDHKSEVAEEPGLPPLAVPRFLCRLGSGIPLIEELATLNIAAAAADHHQRLCNANAAASEILLHHHPHHHQQQHPHHNPHHHQQQPEPQDCCEFDSGIEIDLAGDSMLWSVYPFLPVATPTHHHHHHEGATPEAASASVSASSRWFDDAMAPSPPPLLHPHHP